LWLRDWHKRKKKKKISAGTMAAVSAPFTSGSLTPPSSSHGAQNAWNYSVPLENQVRRESYPSQKRCSESCISENLSEQTSPSETFHLNVTLKANICSNSYHWKQQTTIIAMTSLHRSNLYLVRPMETC